LSGTPKVGLFLTVLAGHLLTSPRGAEKTNLREVVSMYFAEMYGSRP